MNIRRDVKPKIRREHMYKDTMEGESKLTED